MKLSDVLILLVSGLMVSVSISSQSLWIDEGYTAGYVTIPGWESFVDEILNSKSSQAQMPLYLIIGWMIEKIIDCSEWALRAPNLFWAFLGVGSFWLIGKKMNAGWFPFVLAVQPYFWFYMDEARPYVMQIGASSLALYAFYMLVTAEKRRVGAGICLSLSLFCLCGASMLGAVTTGWVYLMLVICFLTGKPRFSRAELIVILGGIIVLGCLGIYYTWTLMRGAGGAVMWSSVGLQNIGLAVYEFMGATGYGPPRYELREMGQMKEYGEIVFRVFPGILAIGLPLAFLGGHFFYERIIGKRAWWSLPMICFIVAAGSALSLLVLAAVVGWPFWGRHLAPAFPFYLVWLAFSIKELFERRPWMGLTVGFLLFVIQFGSAVQIRFSAKHHKDDYRTAAIIAKDALQNGKAVWWVADPACGDYYNVPRQSNVRNGAQYLMWERQSTLSQATVPDKIIFTKPSLMDPHRAVRQFIKDQHFIIEQTFPAFQIFVPSRQKSEDGSRHER
ncbi:MAG: hypothetical protein AAFY98_07635 [Verrucomicrobiota bacterium]